MAFCHHSPYVSNIPENTDGGRLVTRRRLLLAGGGTAAALGSGALYVQQGLQGDDGDYAAPEGFPLLSTRGAFDESGERTGGGETVVREGDWPVDDADALVVFVHGLGAERGEGANQAYTARLALRDAGVDRPVVAYTWDSDRDWEPAKRTADANGLALADWLAAWATEDGRPLHLVGHSLGARVIAEALRSLATKGLDDRLASVSLLGGAIPRDSVGTDGRYGDAIAATTPVFVNFHSKKDNVLGWLYRVSDGTNAVGHDGVPDVDGTPDPYVDVDVTDVVSDHYSYYEPGEGCGPRVADALQ